VKALESIAHELESASDAERLAMREVLDELVEEEWSRSSGSAPRPEVIEFYSAFMENFGLGEG
jgi:hypothetical protein